jgi:hypothetical protein
VSEGILSPIWRVLVGCRQDHRGQSPPSTGGSAESSLSSWCRAAARSSVIVGPARLPMVWERLGVCYRDLGAEHQVGSVEA